MSATSLAQTTILIVDDTPNNLIFLSQVLLELGGKIVVANTGKAALEEAQRTQPDLILLDVIMPEMDGYQTCEQLKANPRTQDIPIIFMTALDSRAERLRAFSLGAVDYVIKPIQPEEVRARVKVHLERQQISKHLETQNIILKQTNKSLVREIAERQKIEASLQKSEEKLRSILDSLPVCIIISKVYADGGWESEYFSQNVADIFGYDEAQFKADPMLWKSRIYPDDWENVLVPALAQIYASKTFSVEYRIYHRDGSIHWLSETIFSQRDEIAQNWRVTVVGTDITTTKQSETKLNEILNSTIAAIINFRVYSRQDWQYDYYSASCEIIFGFTAQELSATRDLWISRVVPEDVKKVIVPLFDDIFAEKTVTFEYRFEHKDGSLRWLTSNLSSHRDEAQNCWIVTCVDVDITRLKQTELSLQASQRHYATLTEMSPVGIFRTDLEGNCRYVNPKWCQMAGLTPEEAWETGWVKALHPEDRERTAVTWYHAAVERLPFFCETRFCTKEGIITWLVAQARAETDENGQITGYVGTVTDITERKQAEIAVVESEEQVKASELRLRQITDAIPSAVYQYHMTPDWKDSITFVSRGWIDLFEITLEATQADLQTIWNLVHPDDVERLKESIAFSATHLTPWQAEYRITTPSGQQKWLAGSSLPIPQVDGSILWNGVIADVTERKHLEAAVGQLNEELELRVKIRTQELQQQTQLLQTILNSMGDGVIVADSNGRLLLINPAAERIIGVPISEMLCSQPNDSDEFFVTDGNSLRRVEQIPLVQAIQGESINNLELLLRNHHHREGIYLETTARPLRDVQGELQGGVVVFRDITKRKKAEAALREANLELENRVIQRTAELKRAKEAAEATNRAKSIFLANMSHELRTPLNAILGFSQLMSRDSSLTQSQKEYLGIINRSGEHLLNLINDILEMTKIEAGQIVLNPNSFDLHHLLDTLEKMFKLRANKKQLTLRVEIATDVPQYITTDENKLRQVLINLLGNAVKFTHQGQVILKVQQQKNTQNDVAPTQTLLYFEVEDSGVGIPSNEIEHIFEPFVQIKNEQKMQEGTGLGLPISQQFVKLLGGNLNVISELNRGATFYFTIPVSAVTSTEVNLKNIHHPILGLIPNQPRYRILVVEDRETNRQLLSKFLTPLGFDVREAGNGQEALQIWETWQPHLIWMDIRMPVMDGYEATRQIRTRESASVPIQQPCKIIALTASAFAQDRDNILAAGCDDFIPKPFQESALLEKMAQHLGVEYIYEQTESFGETDPPEQVTANALKVMPLEWINQLYQTAIQLNTQRLLSLIGKIPSEHSNLAEHLKMMVNNYDFENLTELAQQALENES